jgi:dTDP-4-amino-4,6-dideoxygalactose transaminase
MKEFIPYGRQYIDQDDILEVVRSLKKDLITTGNYVLKFEQEFKKLVKSKYVLSCNSATSGLYMAFRALNIKPNDNIVLPVVNFVAASNALKLIGANVYFADVCPLTGHMRPNDFINCVKKNKIKSIKAVITMYLGGYPQFLVDFYQLKKKHKFFLIEDACHALGASFIYKNQKQYIGSCKLSDICIFSLHPLKTITSGEGGVITTNSKQLYNKLVLLRNHGIKKKNYIEYDISLASLNFRLSDINCALAFSQLKKIHVFVKQRKKIFERYNNVLSKYKLFTIRKLDDFTKPSYHLYTINLDFKKSKLSKKKLVDYLFLNKILTQQHYIPINNFSFYKQYRKENFSDASLYFRNSLSIPIYFNLNKKKQNYIINLLLNFFKKSLH